MLALLAVAILAIAVLFFRDWFVYATRCRMLEADIALLQSLRRQLESPGATRNDRPAAERAATKRTY